jgi:hypothetical protein
MMWERDASVGASHDRPARGVSDWNPGLGTPVGVETFNSRGFAGFLGTLGGRGQSPNAHMCFAVLTYNLCLAMAGVAVMLSPRSFLASTSRESPARNTTIVPLSLAA